MGDDDEPGCYGRPGGAVSRPEMKAEPGGSGGRPPRRPAPQAAAASARGTGGWTPYWTASDDRMTDVGAAADRTGWRGKRWWIGLDGVGGRGTIPGGIGSGGERKKRSTGTRGPRATKKTGREVARSGPGQLGNIPIYREILIPVGDIFNEMSVALDCTSRVLIRVFLSLRNSITH
jgi:hypothetical protein